MVSEILGALYSKVETGRGKIAHMSTRKVFLTEPGTWVSMPMELTVIDATLSQLEGTIEEKVTLESIADIGDTVVRYQICMFGLPYEKYEVIK